MVKLFPASARTEFVDLVCAGVPLQLAARRVGASERTGTNWWSQSGGMQISMGRGGGLMDPAPPSGGRTGRALTLDQRGMIQMGRRQRLSYAQIGEIVGRDKSVIWREVNRNTSDDGVYYASVADARAHQGRRRPKTPKLVSNPELAWFVEEAMDEGWSPKLIAEVLAAWFPDDRGMQLSHERGCQMFCVSDGVATC